MKKAICMFISALIAVILVSCGGTPEGNVVSLNSLPVSSERADIISSEQPVSSETVSSDISSETVLSSESVSDSAESSSKKTPEKDISYDRQSEVEIKQFFYENKEIFEDVKDKVWDNEIKDGENPIPRKIIKDYKTKVPFPNAQIGLRNCNLKKGIYKFLDFSFFYSGNNCRASIIYSERDIEGDNNFYACEKIDENWYYNFTPFT